MDKKIFFISGEASGDLLAGFLIKELISLDPSIKIRGIGGERMKSQGMDVILPVEKLGVTGFLEVIGKINLLKFAFNKCIKDFEKEKPDAVVLVDYPGFNLRIAREAKKRNIPVIYFISPQVWAWGIKRIGLIKKYVDLMIVVFRFEEQIYKKHNIPVRFVGHPLLDIVKPEHNRTLFRKINNIPQGTNVVAILPGSRSNEINKILPVFLSSAEIIKKEFQDSIFFIAQSPFLKKDIYQKYLQKHNLPVIISGSTYDILNASDFALVCSGTATLETAIINTPMIVAYKLSFLSFLIAKNLVKIKNIAMVNVVAEKKIVDEYVQGRATQENIARRAIAILKDKEIYTKIKNDLKNVKDMLGQGGACKEAAKEIVDFLNKQVC